MIVENLFTIQLVLQSCREFVLKLQLILAKLIKLCFETAWLYVSIMVNLIVR